MSHDLIRTFRSPGPVASAFLADRTSAVRGLLGPVGGGKTVTCLFDTLVNASYMPVCRDGVIYHKHVVIGSTYGQIEKNLYPTWFHWLPKQGDNFSENEWEGGGGRFGRQLIRFATRRNGRQIPVNLEVIFAAVGDQSVESFARGFEPTSAQLYEADQHPPNLLGAIIGRFGRYPNADMLGRKPDYRGYVVADYNAPDVDNWTVQAFDENPVAGVKLYRQPSGLSPHAENLQNLADGHYQKLAALNANDMRWVRRFILVQYGPTTAGQPVYLEEYSDDMHLSAEPLVYLPDRPILLGFDQDLHPACVIAQRSSRGQLRVLAEVVPPGDGRMGARTFAALVRQTLTDVAPHCEIGGAWCDPAGFGGADTEAGELAWAEIITHELGIAIEPAPSNEIGLRLQAVRDELTFMVEPGAPSLILSRGRTPTLRKGCASHYMFEKRPNEKAQQKKPVKNRWANVQDALQYLVLGERGRYAVIEGKRGGNRDGRPPANDDCVTLKAPVLFG